MFSDIMNLKDCVGFSDSLVLPQQAKTRSGGYLGHGGEGIGGRNLGFDSQKSRLNRDMEEKGIVAVCGLRRSVSPYQRILSACVVDNIIYFLLLQTASPLC